MQARYINQENFEELKASKLIRENRKIHDQLIERSNESHLKKIYLDYLQNYILNISNQLGLIKCMHKISKSTEIRLKTEPLSTFDKIKDNMLSRNPTQLSLESRQLIK